MRYCKGSVIFIVLCVNMFCATLTILFIHIVGLAKYVAMKHKHTYIDDCRFKLLLDITKKYLTQYQIEETKGGIIFNDQIIVAGVDTFRGKVRVMPNYGKYDVILTIYSDGHKKTIKKTV